MSENSNGFKITVKNVGIIFSVVITAVVMFLWLTSQLNGKASAQEVEVLKTCVQTQSVKLASIEAKLDFLIKERR